MKVSQNSGKSFETCPEFMGRAVCVDITPPEKTPSKFGERETFKFVFEIDQLRDDGAPFCVWSGQMTPTLNEKANLRKFIRQWFGRELTSEELAEFDTETLLGRPAMVVVTHTQKDNETYANIAAITPHKDSAGAPLQPSGKFVRKQDRKPKDGESKGGSGGGGGDYRKASGPSDTQPDWQRTKVHVGKHKGMELRDLPDEAVLALQEKWLPGALAQPKLSADDARLKAALEEYHKLRNPPPAEAEDDVPY